MIPIHPGGGGYTPEGQILPFREGTPQTLFQQEIHKRSYRSQLKQDASVDAHPADCVGPSSGKERPPQDDKSLVELKSVSCRDAAILLQPVQFFAHFDFAVPGILGQAVAFAGEDQQGVGNS